MGRPGDRGSAAEARLRARRELAEARAQEDPAVRHVCVCVSRALSVARLTPALSRALSFSLCTRTCLRMPSGARLPARWAAGRLAALGRCARSRPLRSANTASTSPYAPTLSLLRCVRERACGSLSPPRLIHEWSRAAKGQRRLLASSHRLRGAMGRNRRRGALERAGPVRNSLRPSLSPSVSVRARAFLISTAAAAAAAAAVAAKEGARRLSPGDGGAHVGVRPDRPGR